MEHIDRVVVVVPARNEEALLGSCVRAITVAQQRLHTWDPSVQSIAVVVLDACSDGSQAVLEQHGEVLIVHSTAGKVGAARRQGVALGLELSGGPAGSCWIASTDADSRVPPNWLIQQLTLAQQGAELVLGTVLPDRSDLSHGTYDQWLVRNPQRDGHAHVHGANLGIRGDTYLRAGGFASVAEHEDVLLARAVRDAGGTVVSTAACPVATSGRTVGRTPGGLAGYLAALSTGT